VEQEGGVKQTCYTPKEYEAAFHEPWNGRDAVYFVDYTDTEDGETDQRFWSVGTLGEIKNILDDTDSGDVLCATTHCPADDYVHQTKEDRMAKKRTITFTVEDFEYEEILRYARMKGHGGQFPASTFAHYAAIQQMKKYPLSEAEIRKYSEGYGVNGESPKAVQPDAPAGNLEEVREAKNGGH
jgi:hypothetical protein